MQTTVSAGILDKLVDMVKSISTLLGKGLDYLYKIGIEMDEPVKNDDGSIEFDAKSPMDHKFHVVCKPTNRKDYFDLTFTSKGEAPFVEKNVKGDKIVDAIKKAAKEWWDEDVVVTKAGTSLQVGLKKITNSKSIDIQLSRVVCDQNISEAANLIETVVNNDEFIQSMPADTEVFYEISDEGNNIDVEPITAISEASQPAVLLLGATFTIRDNLQYIHWNAKGKQFNNIHEYLNDPIDKLIEMIDTLAELSMEYYHHCPHAFELVDPVHVLHSSEGYTNEEGFKATRNEMHRYITCMETLYCEFDSDFQSTLDEWIRYFKKEADYFIARRLLTCDSVQDPGDTVND